MYPCPLCKGTGRTDDPRPLGDRPAVEIFGPPVTDPAELRRLYALWEQNLTNRITTEEKS